MKGNSSETDHLLSLARDGDRRVLNDLFSRHSERLLHTIKLRIDRRLSGRIDPGDVLQEVYLEALKRFGGYVQDPPAPFFLWLRQIAFDKLVDVHRFHLKAKARDPRREVALAHRTLREAESSVLVLELAGKRSTPSRAAMATEAKARLQEAFGRLSPLDRKVLVLRHIERLTTPELAHELEMEISAVRKRQARALVKLKAILAAMPGGLEAL